MDGENLRVVENPADEDDTVLIQTNRRDPVLVYGQNLDQGDRLGWWLFWFDSDQQLRVHFIPRTQKARSLAETEARQYLSQI
jgi:hypothetical protein